MICRVWLSYILCVQIRYKMSFKDARDALVLYYDNGVIDDEEFCLLYDANRSKNPEFPYEEYGKFDLEEMDNSECKAEFRFRKEDIPVLAEALGIPETFARSQGSVSDVLRVDQHAPVKTIRVRGRSNPYANEEIRALLRTRDEWKTAFKRTKDPFAWSAYMNFSR